MTTATTTPAIVTSYETTPAVVTTLPVDNTTPFTATISTILTTAGSSNTATTAGVIITTLTSDITDVPTTLIASGSSGTTTIVSTGAPTYLSTEISTAMGTTTVDDITVLSTTPGLTEFSTTLQQMTTTNSISMSSTNSPIAGGTDILFVDDEFDFTAMSTTTVDDTTVLSTTPGLTESSTTLQQMTTTNSISMSLTNSPIAGDTGNWFVDNKFDLISFWFGALMFVTLSLVVLAIAMILQRWKKGMTETSPTDPEKDGGKEERKCELEKDLEELRKRKNNGTDWIVMENENVVGVSEVSGGDDTDDDEGSQEEEEEVDMKNISIQDEEPNESAGSSVGITLSSYETKGAGKDEYQTSSLIEDNTDAGVKEEISGHPEFEMLDIIAEENVAEDVEEPSENVSTTTKVEFTEGQIEKEEKENGTSGKENIEVVFDTEEVIVPKEEDVVAFPLEKRVDEKAKEVAKAEEDVVKNEEETAQTALGEEEHDIQFEKDNSCSSDSSSSSSSDDEERVSDESTKKIFTKKISKKKAKKLEKEKLEAEQKRINYERFQENIRGLVKKYEGDEDACDEGDEDNKPDPNTSTDKIGEGETTEDIANKKVIVEELLKRQLTEGNVKP